MKSKNVDSTQLIEIRENGTRRVKTLCQGETLTRESEHDTTDINKIVKRYQKTGTWSHLSKAMPWYGDVTDVSDYRTALEKVRAAQETFMSLPADVRLRFENDPAQLIDFLQDPKNMQEAIDLKLIDPPAAPPAEPPKEKSAE